MSEVPLYTSSVREPGSAVQTGGGARGTFPLGDKRLPLRERRLSFDGWRASSWRSYAKFSKSCRRETQVTCRALRAGKV